jgi:hypothetical protein
MSSRERSSVIRSQKIERPRYLKRNDANIGAEFITHGNGIVPADEFGAKLANRASEFDCGNLSGGVVRELAHAVICYQMAVGQSETISRHVRLRCKPGATPGLI